MVNDNTVLTNSQDNKPSLAYYVKIKYRLFDKKTNHRLIPLEDVPAQLKSIPLYAYESGIQLPYISPQLYNIDGKPTGNALAFFDVEDDVNHDSISHNIIAARRVYDDIVLNDMTDGLNVFATGRGFRLTWSYIAPLSLIKSVFKDAPQVEKVKPNSFLRIAGYRGNSNQGNPPMDRHIARLNKPDDLYQLSEGQYLDIVSGRPRKQDLDDMVDDLFDLRAPPQQWQSIFKAVRYKLKLKEQCLALPFYRDYKQIDLNQAVRAHLNGHAVEIFGRGNQPIFKTDCQYCNGKMKAWIANGFYRCFSASCEAHEGIKPSDWLNDFDAVLSAQVQRKAIAGYQTIDEARESTQDADSLL